MSETESDAAGGSSATDTPEAIMEATYRALRDHGFADLTMQDIADESDKSKASLHYHFDTKEDLFLAFLDYLYEGFTAKYATTEGDDAVERLVGFVDDILCRSDADEDEAFQTALLEIRAQAPYAEPYREKLVQFDAFVRERVETIVTAGIEEGTIRAEIDPADTAAFIATLMDGVNARRVAIGETDGGTRRTFVAYVRENLVAPDADVAVDGLAGDAPDGEADEEAIDDESTDEEAIDDESTDEESTGPAAPGTEEA